MKNKTIKYLAGLLVMCSVLGGSTIAKAMHVKNVVWRFEEVKQYVSLTNERITRIENEQYTEITFRNGFTYTESRKSLPVGTFAALTGVESVTQVTRNYSTY